MVSNSILINHNSLNIYQGSLKFENFDALVFKDEPILIIMKMQTQNVVVSIIVNSMDLYVNVMCFYFADSAKII